MTIQIQGKSLTTNGLPTDKRGSLTASTSLTGKTPIPASEARAGLVLAMGQLNKADQKLVMSSGAFNQALNKINAAARAGGVVGQANLSSSGALRGSDLRVDVQINTPNLNLVPE